MSDAPPPAAAASAAAAVVPPPAEEAQPKPQQPEAHAAAPSAAGEAPAQLPSSPKLQSAQAAGARIASNLQSSLKLFGGKVNEVVGKTTQSVREAEIGAKVQTGVSQVLASARALSRPQGPRPVPLLLFGLGGVGAALVRAILDSREHHAARYNARFVFRAVCDSSGCVDVSQLDDAAIAALLKFKADGKRVVDFVPPAPPAPPAEGSNKDEGKVGDAEAKDGERREAGRMVVRVREVHASPAVFLSDVVRQCSVRGAIVVDCTASDDSIPALQEALRLNLKIVSANKKPFSSSMDAYDRLMGAPVLNCHAVRYESTVGAGLPAIAAVVRGTLSGTLGFVMTGLSNGVSFSQIVREAKEKGFTEPDPRDDLGGVDVARKALILARAMGWRLEMADIKLQPLFPSDMANASVERFMERLPELDEQFAAQVERAASSNKVLRYAAVIRDHSIKVGLEEVDRDSPLGRLSGTDNLVEFHTRWYDPMPLVLQGAGAGTGATAAGVLSDIVELAHTR